MNTTTAVPLEEYLQTDYCPDMEYINGGLVERNVGTPLHGLMQLLVGAYFLQFLKSHQLTVMVETRLLVAGRYRIPDVVVLQLPFQMGRVIRDVPVIAVEIKSPDDTLDDIIERCLDYQELGISNILVMDPDKRRLYTFADKALHMEMLPISLSIAGHPDIPFDPSPIYREISERTGPPNFE